MNEVRLAYLVTHPITACNLMKGQLAYMREKGWQILLITSPGEELDLLAGREKIEIRPVPIHREIHLLQDLVSLFRIYKEIRRFKPQIVNASTPKAGLLGMLAAYAAKVPVRIYTLRGLRLETTKGITRKILFMTERLASLCAHQIICVSESLRRRFVDLGIASENKTIVLAHGSSNGVDLSRFHPNPAQKDAWRGRLGIPEEAHVLGYVGRFVNDKGILNLLEAFELLLPSFPSLRLMLIGGDDHTDPLSSDVQKRIRSNPQIIEAGFVADPADYYGLFDLLVFPSYREGFPNAPMEAAAAGIPTVGFRTTGTIDAIEENRTGALVPVGDSRALADAISRYLKDDALRTAHGRAAKERVTRFFQPEVVWNALYEDYKSLLASRVSRA